MSSFPRMLRHVQRFVTSVSAVLLATHAMCAWSQEIKVVLSGNQEIPPVATSASGTGTITVTADKAVTGSVTITGMSVTVAHIHQAAAGTNGPIVVPLVKTSDTVWAVPPGTRLTDVQYESFKAGILYFNIHSEAYKSGEIRAQIKP